MTTLETAPETTVLLRMEGIYKSFPGVQALSDAKFDLSRGEVHALVGENGAGKSTLMKILGGIYHKDAGHIYLEGQEVEIHNPHMAQNLGISIVHQELNLMPHLTVAQNIFIGREPRANFPFVVDDKTTNQQAETLFEMLNLRLDPNTKVADLTVAKQQMVEIAKALSFNAKILVMDEPTAALTDTEINELFTVIRQLREKGVGIVHISHRLEELRQISDRVTVMRDGKYIGTLMTKEAKISQIISLMVGRTIYESTPELPENPNQDVVLEVRNLNRGKALRCVSFNLKKGEILGFAGLIGAGRTEVARAIFGADSYETGEIFIKGFTDEITSKHPNITIVDTQYGDGDQLKSTDLAKAIIQAHPNLKGFFGANEGSIIGVLNAVKELGMEGKITVIGYDSGQQQIDAIKSGVEAGAITQNPIGIGYKCVEAAYKAYKGESFPKTIDTGFFWYDKTNIDDPKIQAVLYK
jgi:ABC-type sugar transport system ATPase subunit